MLNCFFFFVLTILALALMKLNPWALLVPVSSLLVSFSFALGTSFSKFVEGILLIAVRRPYDLGDRIYICNSHDDHMSSENGTPSTFFVEGINVTTTTLRYSKTNEVSTVFNWTIADYRIINCNRSPLAVVVLGLEMHTSILDDNNLEQFQQGLKQYVLDQPRIWDSLAYCRHDMIDPDAESVMFKMAFRHRQSWQEASRIKLDRAALVRYIHETADKLGVNHETPALQQIVYKGGSLNDNDVKYDRNLTFASNIQTVPWGMKGAKLDEMERHRLEVQD